MKPIEFKGQTKVLKKTPNLTGEDRYDLPVHYDRAQNSCISRWKLSVLDRFRIAVFGKIWMFVESGVTQPPVWLDTHNQMFRKVKENKK